MTDAAELRRDRRAPAPLSLVAVAVDADDGEVLNRYGATHGRVGGAYFWRPFDQQGTRDPRRRFFLIAAGDEPAGVASLADEGGGVVEIVAFGLVPEFIGRGFGAEALSVVVEATWGVGTLVVEERSGLAAYVVARRSACLAELRGAGFPPLPS